MNNEKIIYFSDYIKSKGLNYIFVGSALILFFFLLNPFLTSAIAPFVSPNKLPQVSYYSNIGIVWLELIGYACYLAYGFRVCSFREEEFLYCIMIANITISQARKIIIIFKIHYFILILECYKMFYLGELLFVNDGCYYISYRFNGQEWTQLVASIITLVNYLVMHVLSKVKQIEG